MPKKAPFITPEEQDPRDLNQGRDKEAFKRTLEDPRITQDVRESISIIFPESTETPN